MTTNGGQPDDADGQAFGLWSDDPARTDLLAFDAIAETLVDAVLDDSLDPVALGVSGRWGSGKTTVLNLIEANLAEKNTEDAKVLPILTEAWRYDPALGAKESLITEVLDRLANEVTETTDPSGAARRTLSRLVKRIDWAKAAKMAAKASVTMQISGIDSILELVKAPEGEDEAPRTLDGFRTEFAELLESDALKHVRRVVVLVDDLDRCLPPTVVDTLETIRLFLAVPKMSFIIAADEDRVADAIGIHFPGSMEGRDDPEHPSRLYLHKIVQTTIPLPSLSRFDTQAYLLLLQIRDEVAPADMTTLIDECSRLRSAGATLDEINPVAGVNLTEPMAFAARLTPILYEKFQGNPRRIKRFLNDLRVRQSVASRRGIALTPEVIAKLMVLEHLVPEGFKQVMDWMAHGDLRNQMAKLEQAAGRAPSTEAPEPEPEPEAPKGAKGAKRKAPAPDPDAEPEFADDLLRWAKLPPQLGQVDLTPYLHLAASFSGRTLVDTDLPERLRDIASNLLSSSRAEQRAVQDTDLTSLRDSEPEQLLLHLGRAARDRPTEQKQAVAAILRLARLHPGLLDTAATTLGAIPGVDVEPATVLQFDDSPDEPLLSVLRTWRAHATNPMTSKAVDERLRDNA